MWAVTQSSSRTPLTISSTLRWGSGLSTRSVRAWKAWVARSFARSSGADDTPMQRVRLSTAHAHILLSDKQTCDHGLALLDQTAQLALASGLSHQLRSIQVIRHDFERSGGRSI